MEKHKGVSSTALGTTRNDNTQANAEGQGGSIHVKGRRYAREEWECDGVGVGVGGGGVSGGDSGGGGGGLGNVSSLA